MIASERGEIGLPAGMAISITRAVCERLPQHLLLVGADTDDERVRIHERRHLASG